MKLSLLLVSGILSIVSVAACTAPAEDETETAEAEIINFPASVFANATPIAYGQTLPNETFLKAKQFSAVKFTATVGQRLTGTVKASDGKKSIVYVVRKEGNKYVNVKAGGVDTAAPNIVIHTLEHAGEHFLVYRTVPRSDATFSVKLEKAASLQVCADVGVAPSIQALAGAVKDGEVPSTATSRHVWIERRACTYATGCVKTKEFHEPIPSLSYVAKKSGANFVVKSSITEGEGTLSASGVLSGSILVNVHDRDFGPSAFVPVRGTVSATCMSIEETFVQVPVDAENYIEFRIKPQTPSQQPLATNVHPPAGPLPVTPELETISDEEVLSRFPRGATTLMFPRLQGLNQGVAAGVQRYCHPLTSCSAPEPVTERGQDNSACMRYAVESGGLLHNALIIEGAKVSGRDGYALITNRGLIPIEDGIGKVGNAVLRVGETSIQLTYPARNIALENERRQEASNSTCTFRFAWPEMQ